MENFNSQKYELADADADAVAETQLDPAIFELQASQDVDGSILARYPSSRKLFDIIQLLELAIIIEPTDSGGFKVSGDLDMLQWKELLLLASVVQRVIIRANIFHDNVIKSVESVVPHKENKTWNPILTLLVDSKGMNENEFESNLKRAKSIGINVLNALKTKDGDKTLPLNFDGLSKEEVEAVRSVKFEFSCQFGGHSLKRPIVVVIDNHIECKLHGKLSGKPDRSEFCSHKEEFIGKCRGFVNDHKQRTLFFSLSGGSDIEIGFVEDHVKANLIKLEEIECWNRLQCDCKIEVKQTKDVRGQTVYVFESIMRLPVPVPVPVPKPDLLSICFNQPMVTEIKSTSSYESCIKEPFDEIGKTTHRYFCSAGGSPSSTTSI
jgi:hypothetical protein